MNNSHVIGEKFLELIANKRGQVLSWPLSVRALGHLAIDLLRAGEWQLYPPYFDIKKYPPVPLRKNHKELKFTFACQYHDGKIFKLADDPVGFNPQDPETQFELALRTIAAHTAIYQGHKQYARKDFDDDSEIHQHIQKHPELRQIAKIAWAFGATQSTVENQLEHEIDRWQTVGKKSDRSRVVSFATMTSPKLRLAGTSIRQRNGHHIAVSILPTIQGSCAIIATTLARPKPLWWVDKWMCQSAVRSEAEAIKDLLENTQPAHWLAQLATEWVFLYVSPDDYGKLPEEDRLRIEQSAGRKYREMFEYLPTAQTLGSAG